MVNTLLSVSVQSRLIAHYAVYGWIAWWGLTWQVGLCSVTNSSWRSFMSNYVTQELNVSSVTSTLHCLYYLCCNGAVGRKADNTSRDQPWLPGYAT